MADQTTKPLIDCEDRQPDEQVTLRLRPDVARDLRAYGEYASSSQNHIVSASLKRLFGADKGFKEYREQNPNAGSVSEVKVRVKAKGKSA